MAREKAWLVHGADGTDEISICGATFVAALEDGAVRDFTVHPEDAGLPPHPFEAILGGTPAENAAAFRALLDGAPGAYRDAVLSERRRGAGRGRQGGNPDRGRRVGPESIDSGAAARQGPTRLPPPDQRLKGAADEHILDRIKAYKLDEVATRKAAAPLADLEAAAKAAAAAARLCPRAARRRADRLWPDRRDQEGQPLQGPDPRRFRPAGPGPGL